MSDFTPAPWREGPTDGIGQRGRLIVVDKDGHKIADCEAEKFPGSLNFTRSLTEDAANAQLIIAAPDLYEAMNSAMQYLDQAIGPCDEGCECLLHDMHAALNKADGGNRTV